MSLSKSIIRAVCEEYGVTPETLRSKRKSVSLAKARREVSCRLKSSGFSLGQIAMMMNICETTVKEHVYPHYRAKAIERRSRVRTRTDDQAVNA